MQYSSELVAAALGLTPGNDGNLHGSCPNHPDENPSYIAKVDPITGKLVVKCFACKDQKAVYRASEKRIGEYAAQNCILPQSGQDSTAITQDPDARKAYCESKALGIWEEAEYKTDIVQSYLQGRGISGPVPDTIRQITLPYASGSNDLFPCMVAEVTDIHSTTVGIHRTYLEVHPDGTVTKAQVAAPKKSLGRIKGNHIRLCDDDLETLHFCEGIETGLAIRDALSASVWSCISAQNLAAVIVPDGVETVYIWADKDRSGTGGKFAKIAADRLTKQGKRVFILNPDAEIPEGQKSIDWLDVGSQGILEAFSKVTAPTAALSTAPWDTLTMPQEYRIDHTGVYRDKVSAKGEISVVLVATGPLWLSRRRIDLATGETELEICWIDEAGKTHSCWLSRGHAFRSTIILEMAILSFFPIYDGNNREAVRFLALLEKSNALETEFIARRPGWNNNINNTPIYILGDDANLRVHPESAYQSYLAALAEKGSFSEWLRVVRPLAETFPIVLFALVAVCSPPLLRLLRVQNFVIDFWGRTSCGKTTLLSMMASVWGKPTGNASLILSWNNTAVFAERLAAFFGQGLPLFLDDSQTASDKTIEAITYMIANGTGRGRAKPYSIKDVDKFEVVMFTTGEKPLTEKSYPGAKARTIGINGSPFPNVDPTALTTLKATIAQNHGHLARKFVNVLAEIPVHELLASHDRCMEELTKISTNEIGYRYAAYFSAISVTADVMLRIPELAWIKDYLITALDQVWEMSTAEVSETDMAIKALQGIAGWIESNQRHFAVPGSQTERQPTYGAIKREDNFVAILPHIFRQALREIGIPSEAAVLAEWKKQNLLLHHPARNQWQVKVEGKAVWCICIKNDALFPNTEAIVPSQTSQAQSEHSLPN